MTALIDPTTQRPLPPDSVQRVLYIAPKVHVYNPPPLTHTSVYVASTWTQPVSRQIFTARLRILETSIPLPAASSRTTSSSTQPGPSEQFKVDILLEDPSNGELFAAVPYTSPAAVEQVSDSSRFFAIRVQDPQGRKATLGIGFEERAEAFDFSVSLQEAKKGLVAQDPREAQRRAKKAEKSKQDYSLKEGETITISLGGKAGSKVRRQVPDRKEEGDITSGAFSLPPPPSAGSSRSGSGLNFGLPPPPSAQDVRAQKQQVTTKDDSVDNNGFDDGEFGEFQ